MLWCCCRIVAKPVIYFTCHSCCTKQQMITIQRPVIRMLNLSVCEGAVIAAASLSWLALLLIFGPTFGVMFSAFLLVLALAWLGSYRLETGGWGGVWLRRARHGMYWLGSVWLLSLAFVLGVVFAEPDGPVPPTATHLIILGAGLKDGDHLSVILQSRLDRALELARSYPNLNIIVSGGKGTDERLSEAAAMQRYLLAHGVKADRIQQENRSTSTRENIVFSRQLLLQQGALPANLVLLTSDFHLYRARQLAEQAGLRTTGVRAPTPFWVLINYSIREYFAIIKDVYLRYV